MTETCINCRWFRENGFISPVVTNDGTPVICGSCRKKAPQVGNAINADRWPLVYEHDFCGEYEAGKKRERE